MSSWLRHFVTAIAAALLVWVGTPTASSLPIVPTLLHAHGYDAALKGGQVVEAAMERGPPAISYDYKITRPAVGFASRDSSERASDPQAPDTYDYDSDTRLAQVDHSADRTTNAPRASSVDPSSLQPREAAANGADEALSGGRYLFDNWHKGTFPNRTQSVNYHLAKHGKGRTASEYTRDAMDFYDANRSLGTPLILRDGTAGLRIQTKQPLPGGGTQNVGGLWTSDGRLVTFWG